MKYLVDFPVNIVFNVFVFVKVSVYHCKSDNIVFYVELILGIKTDRAATRSGREGSCQQGRRERADSRPSKLPG